MGRRGGFFAAGYFTINFNRKARVMGLVESGGEAVCFGSCAVLYQTAMPVFLSMHVYAWDIWLQYVYCQLLVQQRRSLVGKRCG